VTAGVEKAKLLSRPFLASTRPTPESLPPGFFLATGAPKLGYSGGCVAPAGFRRSDSPDRSGSPGDADSEANVDASDDCRNVGDLTHRRTREAPADAHADR
jgi:hypothetical protein